MKLNMPFHWIIRYRLLSLAMLSLVAVQLTACDQPATSTEDAKITDLQFLGITPPITPEERNQLRTSSAVSVNGKPQSIGYTKLLSVGDQSNHESN